MSTKFDFHGAGLEQLIELLGRRDSAVYHFAEDLEACFGAFLSARAGDYESGLPPDADRDLERARSLASALAVVLGKLPGDIGRLLDLHLLSEDAFRRMSSDIDRLGEPLNDLAAAIRELRRSAADDGIAALEDKLVCAITSAYRNRFKVNPSVETSTGFVTVLKGVLELVESEDSTLAGLADRMTPERVARLLAARVRRTLPRSRLELNSSGLPRASEELPRMKPLFTAAG